MKTSWKIKGKKDLSNFKLDYSDFLISLLSTKDFESKDEIERFLNPEIEDLYDPFQIHNMDKAVKSILSAVKKGKKIFVYGDYDVDGVSATSVLWEFLYFEMKAEVLPYIPHRVDEGYGLHAESIEEIIAQGGEMIITVDCGIRDHDLIDQFRDRIEFIITDHHELPENLPNTVVIHPRHPEGNYPEREISGGMVAWKLVQALRKKTKNESLKGIDLAALSSVCDVMPLTGENRVVVKYGLEEMRNTSRTGLLQMILESGIEKDKIDAYHLGFVLGPRINAAGRLAHAIDAVRLMVTPDQKQAYKLARHLAGLNLDRQNLTKEILAEAEHQVVETQLDQKLLFVCGEGWPEGIVGLVAGRLAEKYNKPALVASLNGESATGSARSVPAFNVIEAIEKNGEKLKRYGGHAQAAGFTVEKKYIEDFRDSLQLLAQKTLSSEDLQGELEIDLELDLADINFDIVDDIKKLEPFGYGNAKPVFLSSGLKVASARTIGSDNNHLKMTLFKDGKEIDAIGFRMGERISEIEVGDVIDVVYNLDVNEWNGNSSLQLVLKDFSN